MLHVHTVDPWIVAAFLMFNIVWLCNAARGAQCVCCGQQVSAQCGGLHSVCGQQVSAQCGGLHSVRSAGQGTMWRTAQCVRSTGQCGSSWSTTASHILHHFADGIELSPGSRDSGKIFNTCVCVSPLPDVVSCIPILLLKSLYIGAVSSGKLLCRFYLGSTLLVPMCFLSRVRVRVWWKFCLDWHYY